MKYVDGFVLVVSKKNLPAYRKVASTAGKVWRKHGALEYFECVGDDLKPQGAAIYFPKLAKTKPGELVVFSFIVFKSRQHRDRVNANVMKDPVMTNPQFTSKPMPFDMKRIAYAGFKVLVEA